MVYVNESEVGKAAIEFEGTTGATVYVTGTERESVPADIVRVAEYVPAGNGAPLMSRVVGNDAPFEDDTTNQSAPLV